MTHRARALVCIVLTAATACCLSIRGYGGYDWLRFLIYLLAVLISSGMKVALPKSDGTMSVSFIFIFLAILQLSPLQATALALASVLALSKIKVVKSFTMIQILFNLANVTTATVLTWYAYHGLLHLRVSTAPALAGGAVVYFLANTVPVALIIAWESNTVPIQKWHKEFFWYFPFYVVGAALVVVAHFVSLAYDWWTSLLLIPTAYIVYRTYCSQVDAIRDRERHILETKALHLRTIEALAMAIEAKDRETHRHLFRVRVYVSEIGKLMGLDDQLMQALLTASFLHDIGKLAVPEYIINKPGKLTKEEFEKIKIHPVVGADILERVQFPYPVVPIVRAHHEAWDGSGYPEGLKGEEIPIGARILSVVDCFDALASERPYRKALPIDEAMAFIKAKSGTQFDPKIAALLESHCVEMEEKARRETDHIEPLKADFLISRGAAPAAGFEQIDGLNPPGHDSTERVDQLSTTIGSGPRRNSLDLIAEASQESQALFELGRALGSSLSAHDTSSMMCHRLHSLIPFDTLAIYLRHCDSLEPQYLKGRDSAFSREAIAMGAGLSGWVAQNGRPIVNGNPTVEPNYLTASGLFGESSSAISIPLVKVDGTILGVLTLYSRTATAFSNEHLRILQAIEPKFSLSLENALQFGTAEVDSKMDHLTQLPNMRCFLQQIEIELKTAREDGSAFGVALCDLNSFKRVNDRYGHVVGNRLLTSIGSAFRNICDRGEMVARMGGDEFLFLIHAPSLEQVQARLQHLSDRVRASCAELSIDADVSASCGIAMFPSDGQNAEELLGVADRRMYQQKQSFYDELRTSAAMERPQEVPR